MGRLSGLRGRTIDGVPAPQFALRLLWAGFKLLVVLYFATSGAKFFYQGF